MKSSMTKTSGTYPDTDFHWFLGFLSDELPLGLAVEVSLGIYIFLHDFLVGTDVKLFKHNT